MYCSKCNAQNENGAAFCRVCGEPLGGAAEDYAAPSSGGSGPVARLKSLGKTKLIGIAAVGVVMLAAIILIVSLIAGGKGGGWEKVATDSVKCLFDRQYERSVNYYTPEELEWMVENFYDCDSVSEMLEAVRDSFESTYERLDDYEVRLSKIEITRDKDLKKSEITKIENSYSQWDVDLDISEGKEVTLKVTWMKDGDEVNTKGTVTLIRVDEKWYLSSVDRSGERYTSITSTIISKIGW